AHVKGITRSGKRAPVQSSARPHRHQAGAVGPRYRDASQHDKPLGYRPPDAWPNRMGISRTSRQGEGASAMTASSRSPAPPWLRKERGSLCDSLWGDPAAGTNRRDTRPETCATRSLASSINFRAKQAAPELSKVTADMMIH